MNGFNKFHGMKRTSYSLGELTHVQVPVGIIRTFNTFCPELKMDHKGSLLFLGALCIWSEYDGKDASENPYLGPQQR